MKENKKEFLKTFGSHLAKIRKQKNISQEKLAFETDIEISTISRIERGIMNISIYNAYKIANSLGVSNKELFNLDFKK